MRGHDDRLDNGFGPFTGQHQCRCNAPHRRDCQNSPTVRPIVPIVHPIPSMRSVRVVKQYYMANGALTVAKPTHQGQQLLGLGISDVDRAPRNRT